MTNWDSQLLIVGEIALAMLLGGLIGLERELAQKPAGLRTHILVAGASALLVGLAESVLLRFGGSYPGVQVTSDPLRIMEAIIAGISFLGAGTIFRHDKSNAIEGLTTAASILFAAAIGISVALHQLVIAIAATALVLLVIHGGSAINRRLSRSNSDQQA
jgi:putative Mg2+ transporter-C (MgtC) family protein